MAHNKYLNLIPWNILKEHLGEEKQRWMLEAIDGTGESRDKACGRVQQLNELLNLPNTLDMLYKEEQEKDDGKVS